MIITIFLYVFVIISIQEDLQIWMRNWFSTWGWNEWVIWIMKALGNIMVFIIAALTFTFTSSIVASPFNDLLAEKTEKFAHPPLSPIGPVSWTHHVRLIGIDLLKTLAATTVGLIALLFSLIPIINILSFIAAFLLVSFQYISYPQTRRGTLLKESTKFLWNHTYACIGFGMTITFLFALPFVATVALPLAVVGGTLLVARAQGSEQTFRLK